MKIKLIDLISKVITGEWGDEDVSDIGTAIIKTTNFRKDGSINFNNIEKRIILKRINDGETEKWVIDEKKIDEKKLINDDIIIEKSGGGQDSPVGRVVFFKNPNNETYLCNNFTQTLRIDKSKVFPKYLFYKFKQLYANRTVLKYQNQTTGIFNLKLERFLQEEIEIPPIDKQYSISTQLDTIQVLIDKRIESIKILNKLLYSYYSELFGDPVNNPKGFTVKKLKDITNIDSTITYGIVQAGPNIETGFPYIKSGDIKHGTISNKNISKTTKAISNKFSKTICREGDVIITVRVNVGEVAIIKKEMDGFNITREIALIKPNQNIIKSSFLHQTLSSDGFKFLIKKHIKGSTHKGISLAKLREIKIPIPDESLQNRYTKTFDLVEIQKDYLNHSIELLQNLFHSVLQNAFNENTQINEQPIFNELIKKMKVEDLIGNERRLNYLITLFNNNSFEDSFNYSEAKEKLFDLLIENKLEQVFKDGEVKLSLK